MKSIKAKLKKPAGATVANKVGESFMELHCVLYISSWAIWKSDVFQIAYFFLFLICLYEIANEKKE